MATQNNHNSFKDKLLGEILGDVSKFKSENLQRDYISKEEQTVKERRWTDLLMNILHFGNTYALSRFQYKIEMDKCEVIGCLAPSTGSKIQNYTAYSNLNSRLIKSIREKNAYLTIIAKWEEEQMRNFYSDPFNPI